jgi:hypothetical protein
LKVFLAAVILFGFYEIHLCAPYLQPLATIAVVLFVMFLIAKLARK